MSKTKTKINLWLRNLIFFAQYTNSVIVILQAQTILQYFYKLLMWQILISSNMDPPLTSYLCLLMIIWKLLKSHQQFVKIL